MKSAVLQANQVNYADRAVTGTVRRLTFRNEQNGYFVARLEVPGRKDELTVVGVAPSISEGEHLEAQGRWVNTKWGRQFKADSVKLSAPVNEAGLVKFLAGALKGIGPTYAEKLVKAFGTKVAEVISNEPHRLTEVPGIGKKRIQSIIDAWESRGDGADLLPWLCGLGLSMTYARRVYEEFGRKTRRTVSENPYELAAKIHGIGFLKADAIARKLGLSESNPHRVRAAILHVVRSVTDTGSCGLPLELLIEGEKRRNGSTSFVGVRELLGFTGSAERRALIEQEIEFLLQKKVLAADTSHGERCIFLNSIHEAEREIATGLIERLKQPKSPIANLDTAILEAEVALKIVLENTQRAAVSSALSENVSVITGGPGTGKTTIMRVIVNLLEQSGNKVIVCAPTGKAAKRASEAIGVPAATVHRTLEWKSSGPQRNKERPLECDALVLDEFSMVDVYLLRALLAALPVSTRIIFVGDADQLPSVGPGKLLTDMISSGRVPTARLTEVFRQAQQSRIIQNAHRVNQGKRPVLGWEDGSDFGFIEYDNAEEAQSALLAMARDIWKLGFDPVRETQVLAPMRRGVLGVDVLNTELQKLLNPMPSEQMAFQGGMLGIGDKVMQIRNNYNKEVFNGEIGYVLEVDPLNRTAVIDFEGNSVRYDPNELDELRLAYALTIHRSQGSEFPAVLMGLTMNHFMMLKRNLLYTGITRARKLMLIYGSAKAAAIAAGNCQIEERYSKLRDWLVA